MSVKRILGTWVLLAFLMTLNGIFRELVLHRVFGDATAGVVSVLLGAIIVLVTTRRMFRPLRGEAPRRLAAFALLLVGLTVAFEFAVGLWVDRRTPGELAAQYAFWRGELWPWLLLLIGFTPFIWGRWTPREDHHAR